MMQMMQMTQPRRPACRVGLLLALWALACAPAPAQEPASPGVRGVRMVPPTGEGGLYWPRWRGPSGQGVVEETGYTDTLVGNDQRSVEDGGPWLRALVTYCLGRPGLPDHVA